ncbi:hypothetical protein Pla108_33360 [Botrimarina colliarenosi]|uniref:DUF3592 domain-containing protein n=1 Tax=Botrimarina colliarenosi TaxID=2528001 RepID=A0A5C6AA42_9BACT|nr:DUF3592 domain-containing protein [Botrimarina colliarenosi]TWT95193.1 hypothetical protein Pla108_33360 [Botrimarina colliarenosi]
MFARREFFIACLMIAFANLTLVGVGLYSSLQMGQLSKHGVEATATVTGLRQFTTGSGSSRTTNYRVAMDVQHDGQTLSLTSGANAAEWNALSKGDPVAVVYLPGDSGLCHLGNLDDVASVDRLSQMVLIGGATVGVLAVSLLTGAWISLGMPSCVEWARGNVSSEPRNVYAAG